jgi:hypothetical protein
MSGAVAVSVRETAAKTAPQLHQPVERRKRSLISHSGWADHDGLEANERDAVQGCLFRVTARHRHEQLGAIC